MRLIAGRWRGRKLEFEPRSAIRPTPDRVRETLFNWLYPVIDGAHCLDLFAGSGALGFEAASRGAARVTLVDADRSVCRQLRAQVRRFDAGNVEVVHRDACGFVRDFAQACATGSEQPCDVLFLDPPFAGGALAKVLDGLADCGRLLHDDSLVYIEAAAGCGYSPPAKWRRLRDGRAGAVEYRLFAAAGGGAAGV